MAADRPLPPGRLRRWPRALAVGAAYVLLHVLTDRLTAALALAWNPEPAFSVALIALGGAVFAPAVVLAVALSDFLLPVGTSHPASLVTGVLGVAAAYCGAGLALRRLLPTLVLTNLRALSLLLATVTLAGLLAALAYALAAALAAPALSDPVWRVVPQRWLADVVGLVGMLPLILVIAHRNGTAAAPRAVARTLGRDPLLAAIGLALALLVAFGLTAPSALKLSCLMFLPAIVAALRFGVAGAAVATLVAQVGGAVLLALGADGPEGALEFQMLMLVLAITALYVAVLEAERLAAAADAARRATALRDQQGALNAALRVTAVSEMASVLAHELSQPLSAIGTYGRACKTLATRPDFDRALLLDTLEKIVRESARGGDAVRRMRDFFRSGRQHPETVRIAELVELALDDVGDRARAAGVALRVDLAAALPPVLADRAQIVTVLQNLLLNAVDAARAGQAPREVSLRVRRRADSDGITVEVEDSGPGIAPEVRAHLFGPFATSKPDGMGLGLSVSRSIAESHGGSLWLEPASPRTMFCFTLPAHD